MRIMGFSLPALRPYAQSLNNNCSLVKKKSIFNFSSEIIKLKNIFFFQTKKSSILQLDNQIHFIFILCLKVRKVNFIINFIFIIDSHFNYLNYFKIRSLPVAAILDSIYLYFFGLFNLYSNSFLKITY